MKRVVPCLFYFVTFLPNPRDFLDQFGEPIREVTDIDLRSRKKHVSLCPIVFDGVPNGEEVVYLSPSHEETKQECQPLVQTVPCKRKLAKGCCIRSEFGASKMHALIQSRPLGASTTRLGSGVCHAIPARPPLDPLPVQMISFISEPGDGARGT